MQIINTNHLCKATDQSAVYSKFKYYQRNLVGAVFYDDRVHKVWM